MGGARTNLVGALPAEVTVGWREGDERFETVTARRPVLEAAVAAVAEQTPGLAIRRGVTVTGLVTGPESADGVPHVTGVLAGEATATRVDLVVDAAGRRSPVSGMLEAIGARRPAEEREDCGFVYYTRHFRSADGRRPAERDMLLQHFESVSLLTLPGDSGTWGVAFITSARDKQLRALRDVPAWEAALALFPTIAHWGVGQPITDVQVIAGIEDRHRRRWWTASRCSPAWSPSATHGPAPTPHSDGELPSGCCTPAPCATCSARLTPAIQAGWSAGSTRSRRPRSSRSTGPHSNSTGTAWRRLTARSPVSRTDLRRHLGDQQGPVCGRNARPGRAARLRFGGVADRSARGSAGRAGPAGQGDLPRLEHASLSRPGPEPCRTPRRHCRR